MEGDSPVDGVTATALTDHRERFNALVAQAQRAYVDFDVSTLERQIRGPLSRVVVACDHQSSGSGSRVLNDLFEPVVELVGQRRLGGGSHDGLMSMLPNLAQVLIDAPRLVFASLANAIVHLQRYNASTDEWLNRVRRAGASGSTATTLRAGQVAAWTLGLSHLRDGALAVAATLDDDALGAALGTTKALPVLETVMHMRENRWWRPGRSVPRGPAIAHRVGGFRGFGGPFLGPPRLGTSDDHIVVCSGDQTWTLHADTWGATLTRREPDDSARHPSVDGGLPSEIRPTTVAAVADITAATVATSYQVLVVEPGR